MLAYVCTFASVTANVGDRPHGKQRTYSVGFCAGKQQLGQLGISPCFLQENKQSSKSMNKIITHSIFTETRKQKIIHNLLKCLRSMEFSCCPVED